jgi:signal transduction histidine kinase
LTGRAPSSNVRLSREENVSQNAVREAPVAPGGHAGIEGALYQVAARLVDSLLHDARNPLNALAINLDVLAEKLKDAGGEVPPSQAKNVGAMRTQIFRVEAVLRQFSEFIAPHPGQGGEVDLSQVVRGAIDVLSYEARRGQVQLCPALEPDSFVQLRDSADARMLTTQAILRGILRSSPESELEVRLHMDGARVSLTVRDDRSDKHEPLPEMVPALDVLARREGGQLVIQGDECIVSLPRSRPAASR